MKGLKYIFKMKNNLYITLLFFSLTFISKSQELELPKVLPPSPNASALGKYGQIPVGLFTGTPQINIPLYQTNIGKLDLPISLSYSSNGIRVDEIASSVGLGWTLNAGGVITRNVMDDADEHTYLQRPNNFPNAVTQETLDYIFNSTNPDDTYDTQSDMYSFNFNGYSGSFYLDEDRMAILTKPSPLEIFRHPDTTYAFKIIDPQGVTYWFGDENSTEASMFRHLGTGQHGYSSSRATSWYLRKIENSFGDEILFNYSILSYKLYDVALTQSVLRRADQSPSPGIGENLVLTQSRTNFCQLSSITTDHVDVSFTYSANNTDFNKLDLIEVKKKNGSILKKFNLGYDVVISSLQNLKNPHITYFAKYGYRLFLTSVAEIGENGSAMKPFTLSYYNPAQIPPRFSYAQDYWGYYNGVDDNEFLVSDGRYFFAHESNASLLMSLFTDVGGDKNPNGNFGKNGLLQKITYPTGGYNELLYEPHSYYGTKIIPPANDVSVGLHPNTHVENCNDPRNEWKKELSINNIPFTHSSLLYPEIFTEEKVPIHMSIETTTCWDNCCNVCPGHHLKGILTIKNNGVLIPIYQKAYNGTYLPISNPFSILGEDDEMVFAKIYIDLIEGESYDFTFEVPFYTKCLRADMSLSYYDIPFTEIETNIEVGGLRLEKVIADDGEGNQKIKSYHYGDKSCLDCSSGVTELPIPAISYSRHYDFTSYMFSGGSLHIVDHLTLSSGNLYNLYSRLGHQIGYTSVIEEYGNDFAGGGILHKYNIAPNTGPYKELDSWPVPGTPFDTSFGTGQELETEVFMVVNNQYKTKQKTVNTYDSNPVLNNDDTFYSIRLRDYYGILIYVTLSDKINAFDIFSYHQKSQWHYLSSSEVTNYFDNGSSITTKTDYIYGNPDHLQPTEIISTTSEDDKTIIVQNEYPHDLLGSEAYMLNLVNENRITLPVQIKKLIMDGGNQLLSTQKTEYHDFNGDILPRILRTAKEDEDLENRIIYSSYDSKGNFTQVSQADGVPVSYVWGYNALYPVAKIENATYVQATAGSIGLNMSVINNPSSDAALRAEIDKIRNALPNAMVTTYTYKPLVGVSSITDPKGYTNTFYYDEFGRLVKTTENAKNEVEKILVEHEYHYGN